MFAGYVSARYHYIFLRSRVSTWRLADLDVTLAVAIEDASEKAAITPGPLKPAREQLGEMLLLAGQPAEAVKEFEKTLTREPRRFRAVYGAGQAAQFSGDRAKAHSYFQQLVEICKSADTERPELMEARKVAGKTTAAKH